MRLTYENGHWDWAQLIHHGAVIGHKAFPGYPSQTQTFQPLCSNFPCPFLIAFFTPSPCVKLFIDSLGSVFSALGALPQTQGLKGVHEFQGLSPGARFLPILGRLREWMNDYGGHLFFLYSFVVYPPSYLFFFLLLNWVSESLPYPLSTVSPWLIPWQ